jgi:signal transduction histidine kinase/ActR/RegA family two-component response regulator
MHDGATHGAVATTLSVPEDAETPAQLQACLRDLLTLTTLPALWTGQDTVAILGVFLEVLTEILHLDVAYVRVVRSGTVIEQARARLIQGGDAWAAARSLQAAVQGAPFTSAVTVSLEGMAGSVRAMRLPLGTTGHTGEVFIACRRPEFATSTERLLGRVAVNQLQVGLTQAQLSAERRRGAERLAVLARAGELLSSTLDYESTLRNVVTVALPELGDFGFFDILEPNGSVRRIVRAHGNPAHQAQLEGTKWTRLSAVRPNVCALSTGSVGLHPSTDAGWLDELRHAPDHCALVRSLAVQSMLTVPLFYEGRLLGALNLFFASSGGRHHTSDDQVLAEELARRAAGAVENARLYRELQEALRHKAEAERRKDEFLAMLGHELRNPLSPILTALQLMRLRGGTQHDRERVIIERQVRHLERLVDDLLDLQRVTQGKLELRKERVELGEVVAQAIELSSPLIQQKRQGLNVQVSSQGLMVDVDRVRLAQVVSNLLTNASKYTPEAGEISVTAQSNEGSILLRVRDAGEGISPELLPQVFDMFVQGQQSLARSQGGLGLGLTIARQLVELHGGHISAKSEGLGKGSEFEMRLPAALHAQLAAAPPREARPLSPTSGMGCRVLIVDDNRDAVELLAEVISSVGYGVSVAYDGAAALQAVALFRPDVVLLDIGLPIIDGYEVASRLRDMAGRAEMTLVAVTGYGQESDKARAHAAGFDHHLVKPIEIEQLMEMLRRMTLPMAHAG